MDDGPDLNERVRGAWDANAAYWDARMVQPDSWQQTLVFPTIEGLLEVHEGEEILEVACGNGLLAQRMAEAGARVVAFDFSDGQVRHARERATHPAIELHVADATDEAALQSFGEGRFEAVVCSMALMDMSDVEPLATALPRLLKLGGRFVFAVTHPAFNNDSLVLVTEERFQEDGIATEHSAKVSRYAHPHISQGVAIVGQPTLQWYFDRSLADLLRPFLERGLVLDRLEEPVFDLEIAKANNEKEVWTELPPILAARLRFPR